MSSSRAGTDFEVIVIGGGAPGELKALRGKIDALVGLRSEAGARYNIDGGQQLVG
jgi:hypothetical protein